MKIEYGGVLHNGTLKCLCTKPMTSQKDCTMTAILAPVSNPCRIAPTWLLPGSLLEIVVGTSLGSFPSKENRLLRLLNFA